MPWDNDTARKRIAKALGEVPNVDVQKFSEYLNFYRILEAANKFTDSKASPPLFDLPRGMAVTVDTVQIYIKIVNYDEFRIQQGEETEQSHARALRLLHLYYSAADRTMENSPAMRVDFHSARMHAVVLEEGSDGVSRDTLAKALAFVEDFQKVAEIANRELARGEFKAELRVGIDVGPCVAINNGTGEEKEPLFLGSAANHAAKLAEGSEAGVYLSDGARAILNFAELGVLESFTPLSDILLAQNTLRANAQNEAVYGFQDRTSFANRIVDNWRQDIHEGKAFDFTDPNFNFTYFKPPLSKLDYGDIYPSNTIRESLVSIYADISGYTDYIDQCVLNGSIKDAVRALYVIREEFQNVVEADFNGRKVRFIGDCIHAIIAEGDVNRINERESVKTSSLCAGGLHSSFTLCKELIGNLNSLGLAIGLEIGVTPVSRIGIRGERSVRVASSSATITSEQMQKECSDNGVKFGSAAMALFPFELNDLIDENGYSSEISYLDVATCLSIPTNSVASPNYARAHAPESSFDNRSHFEIK